jgi:aminoglycoside phosphotransferase (APT) family kinase protein
MNAPRFTTTSTKQSQGRLHTTDIHAAGLDDFGVPGNYFERQISRWSKQYRASETDKNVAMDQLIEWLPENIPADDSVSIVHGDFRLDNMRYLTGNCRRSDIRWPTSPIT